VKPFNAAQRDATRFGGFGFAIQFTIHHTVIYEYVALAILLFSLKNVTVEASFLILIPDWRASNSSFSTAPHCTS
jgi:hypothetical protein